MADCCGDGQSHFAQQVMNLALRKYKSLPKKGKPKRGEEWTPLAAVLSCEGRHTYMCSSLVTLCKHMISIDFVDDPVPGNQLLTAHGLIPSIS